MFKKKINGGSFAVAIIYFVFFLAVWKMYSTDRDFIREDLWMTNVPPICYIFIGAVSFVMVVIKDYYLFKNKTVIFIVNFLLFASLWYFGGVFLKPYIHFA